MVQIQIVIANTRRHYFSTEAENEYNTNFLYLKPPLVQFSLKNKKCSMTSFKIYISTIY